MARVCKITGKRPHMGGSITRSGKAKKKGGIGRHVTKVNKRRFAPNLQRVKPAELAPGHQRCPKSAMGLTQDAYVSPQRVIDCAN